MKKRGASGISGALVGIVFAGILAGAAAAQDFRFTNVQVEGNARIPDATVVSVADIGRGEAVSASGLNDALLRIQASGLFETVEIEPIGSTLVIRVVEYPTINRVNIEGNRRLDDDDLLPLLQSSPRRVYSPTVAEADARAIADAYATANRLAATVTPALIRRSGNRVDLVFEVSEGRVVENERVSFVGNRAFSDRRLRRVVATKQAGRLRAIIGADTFVEDRLGFDRQVLTDFYQSRGYVDFEVLDVASEFSRERDASFVTFNVREGQSFNVGAVSVVSEVEGLDVSPYRSALKLRSGETWNPARLDLEITRLERLALRNGLDFVRVEPRVTRNDRALTLDVELALVRGPRIFVERIDIEGNQTTLDRVVRRQFDTVEGDPFNPRAIQAAADRIRALGFFSETSVDTRPGSRDDQVIVDVDVVEQPTGNLSFGGSFSDDTGFAVAVGFSERNFLGRGQSVSLDIQTGSENATSSLRIVEPAFLGRDLTLSFSARYATTEFDNATFTTEAASITPGLGFPLGDNSRLFVYYEFGFEDLKNVSADASPILAAEAGEETKSAIGYRYTYNTISGGLNPNAGIRLEFSQELAGLGGDVEYLRTTARGVAQRDIFNEEVTIRAILEGGVIKSFGSNGTRVTDRFFLNGRQLRGFASRGVGPRDTGAVESDVLGGNQYISARFEADFPLGLPEEYGISGGIFADFASVWGLDNTAGAAVVDDSFELRSSIGVSVFWDTPIGPLRLNFARPIDKNPLDEENTFDITISTQF